ncbi:SHOCT domain-containing protein [Planococcus sp. APC 3906]|uniref:SHOCT domain-containing protein n=1 Tax=Planococcus sp. APC 3906 TaxID=3035194 RepID=UPI0025B5CCDB|nr:SHOCT domain-containing protein [Planococcus sp. APC 3906]MDN3451744.1 SHOCT domain-containing protein [Planococcus sp. APC 3906]
MMGPGWGMGLGGGFLVLIIIIVIAGFGIYYIVKNNNNNDFNRSQKDSSGDAMEIAKKRFAKGEISTEEFEEIKRNLL